MAQGMRNTGDIRVLEALDDCVARLRRGESLQQCLMEYAELAGELAPLLWMVAALEDAPAAHPPQNGAGLARARDRFLAAASDLRVAQAAPTTNGHAAFAACLDDCLARLKSGLSVDDVLAEYNDQVENAGQAERLRPLLELAAAALPAHPAPALQPAAFQRGRDRFLAAASDLRVAQAAPTTNGQMAFAASLDDCLARLRSGLAVDDVLAAYADQAASLLPLLELAAAALPAHPTPALQPAALQRGRDRFLAAAAQMRTEREAAALQSSSLQGVQLQAAAAAAGAAVNQQRSVELAEVLDVCLDRILGGEPEARVLAAYPALAESLRPLLAVATQAAMPAHPVPPAAADALGRARDRFMQAVPGSAVVAPRLASMPVPAVLRPVVPQRAATMQPSPGVWQRLADWFMPSPQRGHGGRMAVAALGVFLFLFLGNVMVAPAAAKTLPGDPLYPIKRLQESVLLLAASFDSTTYARVTEELSDRRAEEIQALMQSGREEEVTWTARFKGFKDETKRGESPRGVITVARLGKQGDGKEQLLAWDGDTKFQIGRYTHMSDVPIESRLELRVLTDADQQRPVARAVQLLDAVPQQATVTPTVTASITPTVGTTATLGTPETSEPPMTSTITVPILQPTVTLTPTLRRASPTPGTLTPESPATATATVTFQAPTPKPNQSKLNSAKVIALADDGLSWRVKVKLRGKVVEVDVDTSRLPEDVRRNLSVGDLVWLIGDWEGRERSRFVATRVTSVVPEAQACQVRSIQGEVTSLESDAVTLKDGEKLPLGKGIGVPATLSKGDLVKLTVQDCPPDPLQVAGIEIVQEGDQEPVRRMEGTLQDLNEKELRFVLANDGGQLFKMHYDKAKLSGGPLKNGQYVRVQVRLEATGGDLWTVLTLEVLGQPPADTPTPPPATPAPTPSPTVVVQEAVGVPKSELPAPATATPSGEVR